MKERASVRSPDILMVNIYARNYRVLKRARARAREKKRVEVNWSFVLEHREHESRSFSHKNIACVRERERDKAKEKGRETGGREGYRGTGGKGTKLIAGASDDEVEINLDPNLLILSTR